jgi:16S rRNA (cytidine1402-2'-O)-methyltransferase
VTTDTPGLLVLAATPIGDVRDASPRLAELLATADVVAAEDSRRLRRLCRDVGVRTSGEVVAYHEHSEGARTQALVQRMLDGATVLLVTDAGMPSVSDPGYRLVSAAVAAGVRVTAAPGPSAVVAALALSGLPVDRFCFEGFLPRKAGQRRQRLRELANEPRTQVYFEAPHRLPAVLVDLAEMFGAGRGAAVCRELTKTYEEVRRGTLAELAEWAAPGVRGEISLVVAGAPRVSAELDDAELAARVAGEQAAGRSRRDAVDAVALATGVPRRRVYAAAHGPAGGPVGQ